MSLGDAQAALRAMAHPVRLRILSLLTGSALTAADVARELGLTHANASYHLRTLLAGGLIVPDGEERIRGGVAKRYRYDAVRDRERDHSTYKATGADTQRALFAALANELIRRTAEADWSVGGAMTDAELWVEPEVFREVRDRISQASRDLHDAARAPRTPGTIRTSTTIAMFRMDAS
ncbi:ArsR/SmtB family transcription factor [Couchioplanes caeruleus]|uniref:Transcriptional regulator n=2 Tax=Couchioplanes caeruleus TaxID=56438 RepID=A0A1K0G049_9ACTN|nr:helix-turn-helix domain-containing protein [Couchioplanes caeruleus]OJF10682.1 transcriptional regulator [Couchioplanes caeruleus subsp. caeruleus]ROP30989.1 ArsR family transcriptional regulator [Couchioplanes caeruleus]